MIFYFFTTILNFASLLYSRFDSLQSLEEYRCHYLLFQDLSAVALLPNLPSQWLLPTGILIFVKCAVFNSIIQQ